MHDSAKGHSELPLRDNSGVPMNKFQRTFPTETGRGKHFLLKQFLKKLSTCNKKFNFVDLFNPQGGVGGALLGFLRTFSIS